MLTVLLLLAVAHAAPKKLVFKDDFCIDGPEPRDQLAWLMADTGWLRTCEEMYGDGEPRGDRLFVAFNGDGPPVTTYVNAGAGAVAQCVAHVLATLDYPKTECGYNGEAILDIVTPGVSHRDWYRLDPDVNFPGDDGDWRALPPDEYVEWVRPDTAALRHPHPRGPARELLKDLARPIASGAPVAGLENHQEVRAAKNLRRRARQLCDARLVGHDFAEGQRLWALLLPDPEAAVQAALCSTHNDNALRAFGPFYDGVGRALLEMDPVPYDTRRAILTAAVAVPDTALARDLVVHALSATQPGDPLAPLVLDRAAKALMDHDAVEDLDDWLAGPLYAAARWEVARRLDAYGHAQEAFALYESIEADSTGAVAADACYLAARWAAEAWYQDPRSEAPWARLEAYAADPSDPERAAEARRLLSR